MCMVLPSLQRMHFQNRNSTDTAQNTQRRGCNTRSPEKVSVQAAHLDLTEDKFWNPCMVQCLALRRSGLIPSVLSNSVWLRHGRTLRKSKVSSERIEAIPCNHQHEINWSPSMQPKTAGIGARDDASDAFKIILFSFLPKLIFTQVLGGEGKPFKFPGVLSDHNRRGWRQIKTRAKTCQLHFGQIWHWWGGEPTG